MTKRTLAMVCLLGVSVYGALFGAPTGHPYFATFCAAFDAGAAALYVLGLA